jgi:two-component system response regulator (stage 0 sporulation protein F)
MSGKRVKAEQSEARAAGGVVLPMAESVARRTFAREVPALDLSALSLFIINDNEFVRTYMERLFSIMRVGRVITCADPPSAREEIASAAPDIVVLDLDLAGMDGLELLRDIRKGGAGIPNDVAILVASAYVDRDYVLQARESGASWTLVKPLSFRRLYEGLVRVIMDDRPFVENESYSGPDRRLLVGIGGYEGTERRRDSR